MTILSDKSITALVDTNYITVDPLPTDDQYQPASLDVRLGSTLYNLSDGKIIESTDTFVIEPHTRYLGHTHECIGLPNTIAAQLTGRSTVGRKGVLIHLTAGWIDPSFEGEITLEIYNCGDNAVELPVYGCVAQLVFFQLDQPSSGYEGQYQHQTGIETAGELDEGSASSTGESGDRSDVL